jgi:hypothetical protein
MFGILVSPRLLLTVSTVTLQLHGNNFASSSLEVLCASIATVRSTNALYLQTLSADCATPTIECSCCSECSL